MTVQELIDRLKKYPPDTLVYLQGNASYEWLEPESVDDLTTVTKYVYFADPIAEWRNTEVVVLI